MAEAPVQKDERISQMMKIVRGKRKKERDGQAEDDPFVDSVEERLSWTDEK